MSCVTCHVSFRVSRSQSFVLSQSFQVSRLESVVPSQLFRVSRSELVVSSQSFRVSRSESVVPSQSTLAELPVCQRRGKVLKESLLPGMWQKVYGTVYSQAVTHPSTNTAQPCLTSVVRRELVHSRWYGRRHFYDRKCVFINLKLLDNQTYAMFCCLWAWQSHSRGWVSQISQRSGSVRMLVASAGCRQ